MITLTLRISCIFWISRRRRRRMADCRCDCCFDFSVLLVRRIPRSFSSKPIIFRVKFEGIDWFKERLIVKEFFRIICLTESFPSSYDVGLFTTSLAQTHLGDQKFHHFRNQWFHLGNQRLRKLHRLRPFLRHMRNQLREFHRRIRCVLRVKKVNFNSFNEMFSKCAACLWNNTAKQLFSALIEALIHSHADLNLHDSATRK